MATSSLPPTRPFDLTVLLRALRRRALLIGLAAGFGVVIGVGLVMVAPTSYTSTATVRVEPLVIDILDPGSISDGAALPGQYADVKTTTVLSAAQGQIGPAVSVEQLRDAVSVSQVERGPILRIQATMADEELAVLAAGAVAEAYVADRAQRFRADLDAARARLVSEADGLGADLAAPDELIPGESQILSTRLTELSRLAVRLDYARTPGGEIVSPASEPTGPDGIPAVVTVAAAVLLAIGAGVAWALSSERRKIVTGDLDHIFGDLHVDVPASDLQQRLQDGILPTESLEHSIRELRARLRAVGSSRVVVLALEPGPTASWLVAVLADLQARFGEPTRVVDFDTDQLERWVGQSEGVMVASSTALAEAPTLDGSQLVVAAPPVTTDPLGLEAARNADTVVLVLDEDARLDQVVDCVDRLRSSGAAKVAAARLTDHMTHLS